MNDVIIVNKHHYVVIERIPADNQCDDGFLVEREGKQYHLCIVNSYNEQAAKTRFNQLLKTYKVLKRSPIFVLPMIEKDKARSIYVRAISSGQNVLSMLQQADLDETIIEQAFNYDYYARMIGLIINMFPKNFTVEGKRLIYCRYQTKTYEDEKESFEWTNLKYWLYSQELADYLQSEKLFVDRSRIEAENVINKKTVLLVCQFRR